MYSIDLVYNSNHKNNINIHKSFKDKTDPHIPSSLSKILVNKSTKVNFNKIFSKNIKSHIKIESTTYSHPSTNNNKKRNRNKRNSKANKKQTNQ